MFYAYVIKSLANGQFYKGHCENLEKRLDQHNAGKTRSIKHATPFKIVYHEAFETREQAIIREKYFKTAAGRRYLQRKLVP
jgi:putative endonuclease